MARLSTHGLGEKVSGVNSAALKKVRVNNSLRSAIDAALGSLTLANPDPAKRVAAAEAVFKSRDPKALAAVEAALAKETNSRAAEALREARGAILSLDPTASTTDRMEAVETLKSRGDQDAQGLLEEVAAKADSVELKSAAQATWTRLKRISRFGVWPKIFGTAFLRHRFYCSRRSDWQLRSVSWA